MIYTIVKPPTYKAHKSMSRKEALSYYDWFISSISQRLDMLSIAIATSEQETDELNLDFRFGSLMRLGDWFKEYCEHRRLTDEEKAQLTSRLSEKQKRMYGDQDFVLTEKTLSLVHDIGIYCGEVLKNEVEGANWQLFLPAQKQHIHYQQPVITGLMNNSVCNSIKTVLNVASKFAWKTADSAELYNRFIVWQEPSS